MSRTAIILGASGLIGGELLTQLVADDYFDNIISLGRRTLDISHAKLHQYIVDFEKPKSFEQYFAGAEYVFCAIGTTQKNVGGDEKAYKKVDYDIPVNAAIAAAQFSVYGFIMVSAIGANADSNNFYLKLKGVTEEAISKQGIPLVGIMRPSLLLGDRKEKRFGEGFAQAVAPIFSPLLFGGAKKYKPIQANEVAAAMLAIAKNGVKGIKIYEFKEMKALAGIKD